MDDGILQNLASQVNKFAPTPMIGNSSIKVNIRSPLVYHGIASVAVLIILIVFKPSFVMSKKEEDKTHLNFKKLLITIILVNLLILTMIVINNKKFITFVLNKST